MFYELNNCERRLCFLYSFFKKYFLHVGISFEASALF